MSIFKHLFMLVLVLRRTRCRATRGERDIYICMYVCMRVCMYVLCENFLASSLVCIRYVSKFVHQAKINYKDLKDRQPAGKIQLGRNML